MLYGLALLAGIVAGSRVFTALPPSAGRRGWAPSISTAPGSRSWAMPGRPGSSLCWRLSNWSPTSSPRRRAEKSRCSSAPALSAAPCQARRSALRAGSWIIGLIAGVIGAVIGTFGGAEIRGSHGEGVWARPARRIHRGRRRHHPWAHHRLGAAMNRHFDAIVIGAGQAGPPMVGRLAAAGQKVALIERDLIGGTCVNTGCTPTKTMVASAYAAHLARRAHGFRREGRAGRH